MGTGSKCVTLGAEACSDLCHPTREEAMEAEEKAMTPVFGFIHEQAGFIHEQAG